MTLLFQLLENESNDGRVDAVIVVSCSKDNKAVILSMIRCVELSL